jgi:uridine kinase
MTPPLQSDTASRPVAPPTGESPLALAARTRELPIPDFSHASTTLRRFFRHPAFWSILALKLLASCFLDSHYIRDLFVPFLNYFVESGFANPWQHFTGVGESNHFPYPPLMLWILTPLRVLASPLLAHGTDTVTWLHLLILRLPLVAFDALLAVLLVRWYPDRLPRILWLYWASPVVFYVCYWHGQLDIIPTTLFFGSLYLLERDRLDWSAVVFGLALATKSHLLAAIPFLAVYLLGRRDWRETARYLAISAGIYAAIVAPYLPSDAFRAMVYGSPEQARVFANQIHLAGSQNFGLLVTPAAVLLLWFRFAAYEKRNWDLLMLFMGILFAVFVLLTPPQPGYFLWSLPFVIHFFCRSRQLHPLPYLTYGAAYLAFYAWQHALTFTVMQASLAGVVLYMYLLGVRSNWAYRLRKHPILIGVAGDSGAGKDTFTESIVGVLGEDNVTVIAGDDYHRWPRGHEMWKRVTHLDVRGNRLHEQQEHAVALLEGHTIYKASYDHHSGQFTEKRALDPNHLVIFQGLHALSTVALRNLYDLKIFLDPAEDLRQYWKVKRDTVERGYSPEQVLRALDERMKDRDRYVIPQREEADVVIRWIHRAPLDPATETAAPELSLEITTVNSFDLATLADGLRAVGTLEIEHEPYLSTRLQKITLSGRITAEQVARLASLTAPELSPLRLKPRFAEGLPGCLQLIFLACLHSKLRWSPAPPALLH